MISTGNKSNVLIQSLVNEYEEINKNFYFKNFFDKKVYVTKDLNFFELKKLIHNCNLIITCHGASTHLASGFDKKIIDIFDESQRIFIINGIVTSEIILIYIGLNLRFYLNKFYLKYEISRFLQ